MQSTTRTALIAVGGGLACGLLYLAVVSGTPGSVLLAYAAQLPVYLVGLSLGLTPALIAGAIALVAVLAVGQLAVFALFAAFHVVPALLVIRQALLARSAQDGTLEWYPPGMLLGWLTGYALVGLGVVAAILGGSGEGFEETMRQMLGQYLSHTGEAPSPAVAEMLDRMVPFVPGMVGTSWLTMAIANATAGQGLLNRFGQSLRPSPAYREVEAPKWMLAALLLAMLTALGPGTIGMIGQNALIILAVPFTLVGLAVVHVMARRWSVRRIVLTIFYLLLFILGWPAVLIALLGVAEGQLGLRRRFSPPAQDEENDPWN